MNDVTNALQYGKYAVVLGGAGVVAYWVYSASSGAADFLGGIGNAFGDLDNTDFGKTAEKVGGGIAGALGGAVSGVAGLFGGNKDSHNKDGRAREGVAQNKAAIGENKKAIAQNTAELAAHTEHLEHIDEHLSGVDVRLDENEDAIRANAAAAAAVKEEADINSRAIAATAVTVVGNTERLDEAAAERELISSKIEEAASVAGEAADQRAQLAEEIKHHETTLENTQSALVHDGKVARERAHNLAQQVAQINQRIKDNRVNDRKSLANVEARRIQVGDYFDTDRYNTLVAKDTDALLETYTTYVECTTGYPVFGVHAKGGMQVRTETSGGGDARVSVEERVQDCMALQAYMNTDGVDDHFFSWRNVNDSDWTEIRDTAKAVAESNAEFGWDGRIDPALVDRFNVKMASYTGDDYLLSRKVVAQRPFLNTPAAQVMKYGILDDWIRKGPTELEQLAGKHAPPANAPAAPDYCGPGHAAGDGSYIDCDDGSVQWLTGMRPDWAPAPVQAAA
jgi:hypothetical protein